MSQQEIICPGCGHKFPVNIPEGSYLQEYICTCPNCSLKCKVTTDAFTSSQDLQTVQNGKTPEYCGKCRKRLVNNICPKCGKDVREYLRVSYAIPSNLKTANIFMWIMGFIFLIMFPVVALLGGPSSFVMFLGACMSFGSALHIRNIMDKIKKTGVRQCYKCRRFMSPTAVRCIYCKRNLSAWITF